MTMILMMIMMKMMVDLNQVDICGHATLATAHSIFKQQPNIKKIFFHTRSGVLEVKM